MKNLNKILFVAALAATFSLANRASAQYQAVGEDGSAASPKLRQMLNKRQVMAKAASTEVSPASHRATGKDGIAASPKLRQLLNERKTVASETSTAVASVGYRAVTEDGIAASPKLREHLDEHGARFMVAPLK